VRAIASLLVRSRITPVVTAVAFASVDLGHKLMTRADYHHVRSPFAVLAMAVVIIGLVTLVPRVPSRAALLGAGIAAGGALGNLLSVLVWSQGVPDPFVVEGTRQGIAFNLADLFAVGGDALLLSAVLVYGLRHREQLRERV